jgi:hypothetical protein
MQKPTLQSWSRSTSSISWCACRHQLYARVQLSVLIRQILINAICVRSDAVNEHPCSYLQQSFGVQQSGDKLLVPANCIDRWFQKFSDRFRYARLHFLSVTLEVLYDNDIAATCGNTHNPPTMIGLDAARRDPDFLTREKAEL